MTTEAFVESVTHYEQKREEAITRKAMEWSPKFRKDLDKMVNDGEGICTVLVSDTRPVVQKIVEMLRAQGFSVDFVADTSESFDNREDDLVPDWHVFVKLSNE